MSKKLREVSIIIRLMLKTLGGPANNYILVMTNRAEDVLVSSKQTTLLELSKLLGFVQFPTGKGLGAVI